MFSFDGFLGFRKSFRDIKKAFWNPCFISNVQNSFYKTIWNSIINFITKLKVQQWVQSSLQLTQLNYGELLAEYIKENWNRFLDDCYTVLRSSQISPEELLLTLHSINLSIQFTMEYSKAQILFLDILIKRNENGI